MGGEYARQRNYLEKTIESLKRKLAADAEAHRTDELRIMGQNVSLIRELNELRREIKVMAVTVALLQQPSRMARTACVAGVYRHLVAVSAFLAHNLHCHALWIQCGLDCCILTMQSHQLCC